ncbi:MAG: hypothetical protein ACXV8Q_02110 [Methylobacter sp.]
MNFNLPSRSSLDLKPELAGWLPVQKPSILMNAPMIALHNYLQIDQEGISALLLNCTATHFAIISKTQEQPKP